MGVEVIGYMTEPTDEIGDPHAVASGELKVKIANDIAAASIAVTTAMTINRDTTVSVISIDTEAMVAEAKKEYEETKEYSDGVHAEKLPYFGIFIAAIGIVIMIFAFSPGLLLWERVAWMLGAAFCFCSGYVDAKCTRPTWNGTLERSYSHLRLKSVRETEQAVDVVHVGQTGIAYLDRQGMPAYTDFRRIASIRYDAQRKALKIAVSNIDRTLLVLHPSQNGALDGQYIVEQLATQIGEARECYATRGKAELTCR